MVAITNASTQNRPTWQKEEEEGQEGQKRQGKKEIDFLKNHKNIFFLLFNLILI